MPRVNTQDFLKSHVEFLCRNRRNPGNPHLAAVANYLEMQFTDVKGPSGKVERQTYSVHYRGEHFEVHNLLLRLGDPGKPRVVIGAHYDGCEGTVGADDNASAVAVALETARAVAAGKWGRDFCLEFAAWTCEEHPYFASKDMGSARHVASLVANKVSVLGMVCLEMVGYFSKTKGSQAYPPGMEGAAGIYGDVGDFYALTGEERNAHWIRGLRNGLAEKMKTRLVDIALPDDSGALDLSDHMNFERAGIPAVMVGDTAFYRNPHYHRMEDTPDTLDYPAMADLVQGLASWCLSVEP